MTGPEDMDIGRIRKTGGNSRAYTLLRLDRERPDLAAEVRAGRLSANAAAIAAGFRRPATPFETAMKLTHQLTAAERRDIAVRWLTDLGYRIEIPPLPEYEKTE